MQNASFLKSLKCDQNFACTNKSDYDEIIALTELRNKNISVSVVGFLTLH